MAETVGLLSCVRQSQRQGRPECARSHSQTLPILSSRPCVPVWPSDGRWGFHHMRRDKNPLVGVSLFTSLFVKQKDFALSCQLACPWAHRSGLDRQSLCQKKKKSLKNACLALSVPIVGTRHCQERRRGWGCGADEVSGS